MPEFVVEGEIPGIGTWSAGRLQNAAEKSRAVLRETGPDIQWLTRYVTEDRRSCVYIAPGPELISERAARRGVPCNRVSQVGAVIDPTASEALP